MQVLGKVIDYGWDMKKIPMSASMPRKLSRRPPTHYQLANQDSGQIVIQKAKKVERNRGSETTMEEALLLIEEEVINDIAPIIEEDPGTAEYLAEFQRNYRTQEYKFLLWLDREYSPKRVLYPGSGSDIIPMIAFGRKRVVHTSLDDYLENDSIYLPLLGEAEKAIADNIKLPFQDVSFQVIFLSAYPVNLIERQMDELLRVLDNDGLLVLTNSTLIDERVNLDILKHKADRLEVPEEYQKQGEAELEFIVFRKY